MSATSATMRGRVASKALMVDVARITRGGGTPVFNVTTGVVTPATVTTVHEGPFRLRQPTAVESRVLFGEEQVTTSRFVAVFLVDVTGVRIDDVVEVIDSGDADMVGRRFRVVAVPASTFLLYRAFAVEAVE